MFINEVNLSTSVTTFDNHPQIANLRLQMVLNEF